MTLKEFDHRTRTNTIWTSILCTQWKRRKTFIYFVDVEKWLGIGDPIYLSIIDIRNIGFYFFFFVVSCFISFVRFDSFSGCFNFNFHFNSTIEPRKKSKNKQRTQHRTREWSRAQYIHQETSTNRNVDVITRQWKRHPNNCAFECNTCSKCDRWWLMSSQKPIANGIFSRYILFDVNCELQIEECTHTLTQSTHTQFESTKF